MVPPNGPHAAEERAGAQNVGVGVPDHAADELPGGSAHPAVVRDDEATRDDTDVAAADGADVQPEAEDPSADVEAEDSDAGVDPEQDASDAAAGDDPGSDAGPDAAGVDGCMGEAEPLDLVAAATARVRAWLDRASLEPADASARRLATVLADPAGAPFAAGIADGVLRPESVSAAAASLRRLAAAVPSSWPWYVRGAVKASGTVAPMLPAPTVPLSRAFVRELAGHLVLPDQPGKLARELDRLRALRTSVSLAPRGGVVLGDDAATARVRALAVLMERDDVRDVRIDIRDLGAAISPWATEARLAYALGALRPLRGRAVTLMVEASRARDVSTALAVVRAALSDDAADAHSGSCAMGICLPMAFPEATFALHVVLAWASQRAAEGAAPVAVRITDAGDTAQERADAALHGWQPRVFATAIDARAALLRGLDALLDHEYDDAIRAEFATSDPWLAAYAATLAARRGVALTIVLPLGTPRDLVAAIAADVPALVLEAPVAARADMDLVIGRMLRRLGGAADADGSRLIVSALLREQPAVLTAVVSDGAQAVARAGEPGLPAEAPQAQDRSRAADPEPDTRIRRTPAGPEDDALTQEVIGIARTAAATDTTPIAPTPDGLLFGGTPLVETAVYQPKEDANPALGVAGFRNTADTDPAEPANRAWADGVFQRIPAIRTESPALPVDLEDALTSMRDAAAQWGAVPAAERATVLRRIATQFDAHRGILVESAAAEAGATLADADDEVTAAIDAAHQLASLSRELDATAGAVFQPVQATLVSAGAVSPIAAAAEATLAALAAGSGVLLASDAPRTARVLAQVCTEAGVPAELLSVIEQSALVTDPETDPVRVDRVLLAGGVSPASVTPDIERVGNAPSGNSIVVMPSADVDDAVADIVRSAFGHAGQLPTRASMVILVGRIGRTRRFAQQLLDAVRSLHTGMPEDPRTVVGPLAAEPEGDARWMLTQLEAGEQWLIEPRELGPRLWTPGVRVGVQPRSRFHDTVAAVPVLGVVYAANLAEAVRIQNAVQHHLVAGLHTRDAEDLGGWLDAVEAGTLAVNRPLPAPRAQRYPVAPWSGSAFGQATALGGPNRLLRLGAWRAVVGGRVPSSTLHLRGLDARITSLVEAAQPALDYVAFEWVRRGALADAVAWDREFGRIRDVSRIGSERNLLRYRPAPVAVRATAGTALSDLVRVLLAGIRAGGAITVSRDEGIPAELRHALGALDVPFFVETDAEWAQRLRSSGIDRARIIGPGAAVAAAAVRTATASQVATFADEATTAARIELLPFLREQAISITAQRDGGGDAWSEPAI